MIMASCRPIICHESIPKHSLAKIRGEVFLLPTAAGLYRPLNVSYSSISKSLADIGFIARTVEFPGQNGQDGKYSVSNSCMGLLDFFEENRNYRECPVFLFGVCTGALAALFVASRIKQIKGIFAWEVCYNYEYSNENYRLLENKFGLGVDWDTALIQIQPSELVQTVQQRICFGIAEKSKCTTILEQHKLCDLANNACVREIKGVSHVPGLPRGSEIIFTRNIKEFIEKTI